MLAWYVQAPGFKVQHKKPTVTHHRSATPHCVWEVQATGPIVSHPLLHSEFEAGLGSETTSLKQTKPKKSNLRSRQISEFKDKLFFIGSSGEKCNKQAKKYQQKTNPKQTFQLQLKKKNLSLGKLAHDFSPNFGR